MSTLSKSETLTVIIFLILLPLFILVDIWILKSLFNLISYHTFSSDLKLNMSQTFFIWLFIFYIRLTSFRSAKNTQSE